MTQYKRQKLLLSTIILLTLLLAGCGGAAPMTGTAAVPHQASLNTNAPTTGQQKSISYSTQYLIKTLKVTMEVKDTKKAADALQAWIGTTDPRSSSAGIDYEQAGDNLYNISMIFSVQASLYPQIEHYLRDYAPEHLLGFNESVQDVTNDYIDTQSRLTNLRGEQTRLLELLSHAQALGDIIAIQDRLTYIEGQIENIEAHLKALNGQTTFYTISITLQPMTGVPPVTNNVWNIGQVFHDAFAASLALAQGLGTFLIWLVVFSLYLVPIALLVWLVLRWRRHSRRSASPPATVTSP